jgi:ABC-2 type transport system permease protein
MLRLIGLELRMVLRDGAALSLLAVLAGALALACLSGTALIQSQAEGRATAQVRQSEAAEQFHERLADAELPPEEAILSPYRMRQVLIAPLPVLVDFSAGRAAIDPYATTVSMRTSRDTLFQRNGLENPEVLMRGGIDLAFVVVVLAPLVLIGLLYGLFAADRDSGVARLIVAQAGSPVRLIGARIIPRLALVVLPIVAAVLVQLAIGPDLAGRWQAAGVWLLLAALFLSFWAACGAWVNSLDIGAETAAFSLVALWAVITLILPASFSAIVQASFPPPSRFEQIATARAAEVASTEVYENDHPEIASDEFASRLASIRKTWEVAQKVEAATAPIDRRFAARLAAQQRFAEALSWASPALVAKHALDQTAGTDAATGQGFRVGSEAYLTTFRRYGGGFVARGAIMQSADEAQLPRFSWSPARSLPWSRIATLLALAAGLLAVAVRRFARLRPI